MIYSNAFSSKRRLNLNIWRPFALLVMGEGPAVGKAGNCLDWLARGLEINGIKDFALPQLDTKDMLHKRKQSMKIGPCHTMPSYPNSIQMSIVRSYLRRPSY